MGSTLQSLLMLALVVAAIPASLWLVKRLQSLRTGGAPGLSAQVACQLPLGPRERLVVVRVQGRELVLGVTSQQITLLCESPPAPRGQP